MYDELIKRLKYKAGWDESGDLEEAAEAIEELICELADEHNARLDAESRQRWIPVSERLPESGERVLACCRVKWLGGGGRTYVCAAFHSAPKTETCVSSDDIDMEYDEETDEYYLPEGWWEVINNWDDYSFVAIGDFVTHWMPLPPPEEVLTGTDTRGGIRRDDAGNVIDWGITGPPGDVGKTKEE